MDAPLEMPGETAPVSGGLIRLALQHALQHRYSVLLECTFRDKEMVTGTAAQFAAAGYRVEVVAVAAPAPVSRLRAEQRFLLAPHSLAARWTPPDAHETALSSAADVVQALEASAHVVRVQVYGQFGVLYDDARGNDSRPDRQTGASKVLRGEQTRSLSPQEAIDWLRRYHVTFAAADARPGYLASPNVRAGYRHLQADAKQILTTIASSASLRMLAREHIERERTLRRAMAPAERMREMLRRNRGNGVAPRKPYPVAIDDNRSTPEPPSISR